MDLYPPYGLAVESGVCYNSGHDEFIIVLYGAGEGRKAVGNL